jgi:hypothetical protein
MRLPRGAPSTVTSVPSPGVLGWEVDRACRCCAASSYGPTEAGVLIAVGPADWPTGVHAGEEGFAPKDLHAAESFLQTLRPSHHMGAVSARKYAPSLFGSMAERGCGPGTAGAARYPDRLARHHWAWVECAMTVPA